MDRKYKVAVAGALAAAAIAATAAAGMGCMRDALKTLVLRIGGPSLYARVKAANGPDPHAYGMKSFPAGISFPPKGIVDRYGQFSGGNWRGKVHTDADLKAELAVDKRQLADNPGATDRDEYGGWSSGPQLKGTGFFRTEKVDGKWWLVTPTGHLFFSVGVDNVSAVDRTPVDGRQELFQWLPSSGDPLAKHFIAPSGSNPRMFDFYGANLERKYGVDYQSAWRQTTIQRLNSWGFNTLGAWADRSLFKAKIPYTCEPWSKGDYNYVSSGSDLWGKLPDPFDPRFAPAVHTDIEEYAKLVKGDPYFIGYFIDNELSWAGKQNNSRYGIAIGTLAQDESTSPAKAAFVDALKAKYTDISGLNAAWDTDFPDWPTLEAPYTAPDDLSIGQKTDMADFELTFARAYFRTVRDEIKKLDPDHLYLGCRFAESQRTPEVLQAATEYCDVLSFNVYRAKLDPDEWGFLNSLDKPSMITEFNFSAFDRGLPYPGIIHADSQEDRARLYHDYVDAAAAMPNIVGVHWYKYVDQPLTGNGVDGENSNDGLVDIVDKPYTDLTNEARNVNFSIYTVHSGR